MSKTFEFTSPDGKKYEVTAPDSATQEQAYAVLQQQLANQAPPTPRRQPQPEVPVGDQIVQGAQDFGAGLLSGAARIGRGILSAPKLVGLPPIGGQEFIDSSKGAADELMKGRGFMGSAGEFTSELAGTGGVGGLVRGAAARFLPKAASMLARRPTAMAAIEGAGAGALTGEGDWRNVGMGAGAGVAGNALVRGGGRLLQGARQTPQANQLRDMGIDVTAGQGGTGLTRYLEEASTYLPLAANAVRRQREVPYQNVRDIVARSAQPEGTFPVGGNMDEILANTRQRIQDRSAQSQANVRVAEDPQFQSANVEQFLRPKQTLADTEARNIAHMVNDQLNPGRRAGQWTGEQLMIIRDNLAKKAASAPNEQVAGSIRQIIKNLDDMVARQAPEMGATRQALEVPRKNLETAELAAKNAVAQGEFGVAQLAQAADAMKNPFLMELARKAATVLKDDLNRGGTGVRTAIGLGALAGMTGGGYYLGGPGGGVTPLAALYLGLGTRGGQRFMSGQFKAQKKLAELLKKHPTAGATSAAVATNELGDK